MSRTAAIFAFPVTCVLLVAAAESQQRRMPSHRPADAVGATYAQLCASCHGPRLEGGLGPSLVDNEWRHGAEDADLVRSIAEGWPATGMPPFKASLSEQQVRALVVFIREQSGGGSRFVPPGPPPPPKTFKSELHRFRLETLVSGLDVPWGLAFLPDGRLLFTDRVGLLRTITNGALDPIVIGGLPSVWVLQDGGLMDVAVHPAYGTTGWVYLSFVEPGGAAPRASSTRVVRGRIRGNQLVEIEDVFKAEADQYWEDNTHYGSRFIFDPEGYLYYSLGDRGRMSNAQDLSSPYGKLHRVHDDGRTPADNPFVDRPGALKTIWTYGHRNQQGFAFHPVTGDLWSSEHGPRNGDELNVIVKGRNYGWPAITYGINYDGTPISALTSQPGMEQPVAHWTPTIAPAGITFYTGGRFPRWRNHLFVATLAGQHLRRLEITNGRVTHQEVVLEGIGRVRHVTMGPDGCLYLALNAPGRIARLVPADQ